MKNKLSISFDFDGTLQKPHVQEFAKLLLALDIDVWVVTTRYDSLHDSGVWTDPDSSDLWEIIDEVGIPHRNVIFTNMKWKAEFLKDTKVIWHLDDNWKEFVQFRKHKLKTFGIQVNSGLWRSKCLRLLNLEKKRRKLLG